MNVFIKFVALVALLLAANLGCQQKPSEAALAAQEAAKAADTRVASLEQQLAEIKAGKHQPANANQATAEHVSKSQAKALERQLADARKSAAAKHKLAEELTSAPRHDDSKPIIVEVPAGTPISAKPSKELTTSTVQPGDPWEGLLTDDVVVAGKTVWKSGTHVGGVVTQSTPAGRLSSHGGLGIKVTLVGHEDVDTAAYVMVGDKRGVRNAKFIGGGAAVGALIGILSDGKHQGDHALGGAVIGAGAGTAAAAATADTVIRIPADKTIPFTLAAAEKVILKP
jgi:hypothetical protein